MDVTEVLATLGGVAKRCDLVTACSRADVDTALRRGLIVAGARGRYALPVAEEGLRAAHTLSGVLCLSSAALHHGWEVLHAPAEPQVLLPRNRRVGAERTSGVEVHRADLGPDDVDRADGLATGVEFTLAHCARHLPFPDALAVADSALRHGITPATLRRVATLARGPGARKVRRVMAAAREEVANPFESGLRGIAADVPGLHLEPQVVISGSLATVRPDLVDADLRIVAEADSFAWHGDRQALGRDARRYNLLVVDGWLVLRFTWENVMNDPAYVRAMLTGLVRLRSLPQAA